MAKRVAKAKPTAATSREIIPREQLYRAWLRKDLVDLGQDRLHDPVAFLSELARVPPYVQEIWYDTLATIGPLHLDGIRRVAGYVRLYALTERHAALAEAAGELETRAEDLLRDA